MKKQRGLHLLQVLIIIGAALFLTSKTSMNDLYFDLKTGESILKYGIDFKDHFSFIPNLVYIYHHWLYDLIIYFINMLSGMKGLYIFYMVFYMIFGIIYYYISNKITNSKLISIITTVLVMISMKDFMSSRVQSITYSLFLLYYYFINKLFETGNKKYSIYLLIISILILNLHMTLWILTIVLLLPYIVEYLVSLIKSKKIKELIKDKILVDKPKNIKLFLITCLLLLASGLITPLKLWAYKFPIIALKTNFKYQLIIEMKSVGLTDYPILLVLIILGSLILLMSKKKNKLHNIFYLYGISILSLIAVRNISYGYMFIPLIILSMLEINKIKIPNIYKKYNINENVVNYSVSIILIIIMLGFSFINYKDFKSFDYNEKQYPKLIIDYIKENIDDYKEKHFYIGFDDGAYALYNDLKVFIDSRAEVYISEFNNGMDVLTIYQTIEKDNNPELLKEFDIDYYIVKNGSNVSKYLNNNNFELEYETLVYSLYKDAN